MRKALLITVCATAMMIANGAMAELCAGFETQSYTENITGNNEHVAHQTCTDWYGQQVQLDYIYDADDRLVYVIEHDGRLQYEKPYRYDLDGNMYKFYPSDEMYDNYDSMQVEYMMTSSKAYKYIYDDNGNLTQLMMVGAQSLGDYWEFTDDPEREILDPYGMGPIQTYENQDGKIIAYDGDGNKIGEYASVTSMLQGEALPETPPETTHSVQNTDGSTTIYNADGSIKGFKGKKIYTVQEAEMLSKETGNTFKIRYK